MFGADGLQAQSLGLLEFICRVQDVPSSLTAFQKLQLHLESGRSAVPGTSCMDAQNRRALQAPETVTATRFQPLKTKPPWLPQPPRARVRGKRASWLESRPSIHPSIHWVVSGICFGSFKDHVLSTPECLHLSISRSGRLSILGTSTYACINPLLAHPCNPSHIYPPINQSTHLSLHPCVYQCVCLRVYPSTIHPSFHPCMFGFVCVDMETSHNLQVRVVSLLVRLGMHVCIIYV